MNIYGMRYREESNGDGGDGGSGGDGGTDLSSENWRDFVAEDLRGNESLAKFTSLDGLAKSYINAEKMIGKDKIVIPQTDDEWNEAYGRLGRPDKSDGYELKYPEGVDGSDDITKGFLEMAHKSGLNKTQASGLYDWYNEMADGAIKSQSESETMRKEEATTALNKQWGEKYDSNLKVAQRALTKFGDDDFNSFLDKSGFGDNPEVIKFMNKVGQSFQEDNIEDGDGAQEQTPEQIREEINTIMGSTAYTDKNDPNHAISVKKVQGMFQRLHKAA